MKIMHKTREGWLVAAMAVLDKEFFRGRDHKLPRRVRASCGFPRGSARVVGQCWHAPSSADKTTEIFICPSKANSLEVIDILLHEMIHACLGPEARHGPLFKRMALNFGMAGPMTSAASAKGSDLRRLLRRIVQPLGKYPHGAMQRRRGPSSSPSKWVRYESLTADKYRVVISKVQVSLYGAPRDPWSVEMVPVK